MQAFQTDGVPPKMGSSILPAMGWIKKSRNALRNKVAV
jgi:hypothetical protein